MSDKYVLRGHEAVPTDDLFEWSRMFEDSESRRVANTTVDDSEVSTVFLGLDHNWLGGPPLIFETMIFGGPHDQTTWRYATWEQAETHHHAIVAELQEGRQPPDELTDTVTDTAQSKESSDEGKSGPS